MKCVQHSRHGTIFRMPNEDAELLVSSGRYVFISKFAARDATVKPRRRPWLIGAALAAVAIAALLWAGTAHAADKPVPFRVCLNQAQAAQVYKGKLLRYREVNGERCWYAGKAVAAKSEFIPRAMVAAKPARTETQETRAQVVPVGSIPAAGALGYSQEDRDNGLAGAFEALCGGPCPQLLKFEDRWRLR